MSPKTEHSPATTITDALPERVFTRSGSSFDPRENVWEWVDGPFKARIDFGRYKRSFEAFILSLKRALLPFVKGHSAGYVMILHSAFVHFVENVRPRLKGEVTSQQISNYATKLSARDKHRLGTINGLFQKWVALGLYGVKPECATYLLEQRKPGNRKGDAVRTRNPVEGPLTEEEYTSLYATVNAAYGCDALPLWTLILTRLLLACGGRISQYASLKLCDFNCDTSVLSLPQAKKRDEHTRIEYLQFDISPQTGRLIADYVNRLRADGYDDTSALFPERLIMVRGPRRKLREIGDLFYGHCTPEALSQSFTRLMSGIAPPTSRLDFAPMPLAPVRFRYTYGTRLAEEGASRVVIANRLGHADLQHVEVYISASPKIVENIDKTMGTLLAPLAAAFKGQVVEDESSSTQKGAGGSRIIDFRVSREPIGSCTRNGQNCAFAKPVACYTCFRFEPWLDAQHGKVLERLSSEREKWSTDDRMAAVNDEPIRAVREVIELCAQVRAQRALHNSESAS
ncbi:tyrosine-type recombinase/integrase [Paraburkholderia sp. CNPSo 3157]|uniref:Tyrosine-type recombinase/integrase n=1 Tax=Paraburkholderia franconis TaxID=2654983 RepID=A0A7X1NDU5_9BURK|nr:site-specific integrase [Paraburkholderia franconis]MPW19731.1 tyrosine-type recombinase/integrase [Paraburkholderia franconis]